MATIIEKLTLMKLKNDFRNKFDLVLNQGEEFLNYIKPLRKKDIKFSRTIKNYTDVVISNYFFFNDNKVKILNLLDHYYENSTQINIILEQFDKTLAMIDKIQNDKIMKPFEITCFFF